MSSIQNAGFWARFHLERALGARLQPAALRLDASKLRRWARREHQRPTGVDDLVRCERKVYSQNGEDGIIEEIFRRIGAGARVFVEFGVQDGIENCTRRLAEEDGWTGFWFEGDAADAARAKTVGEPHGITVRESFLDRANIVSVFAGAGVPPRPDLMVIDVDGNDLWLWKALGDSYRPRVVVIEYNGAFPPGIAWTMPYDPTHVWDRSCRHGASLDALAEAGSSLGYRLIACDRNGVNAFFVDDSEAGSRLPRRSTSEAYFSPKIAIPWFGHPRRPPADETVDALEIDDAALVSLRVEGREHWRRMAAGHVTYLDARLKNGGATPLRFGRGHPVNLSYHWFHPDGTVALFDGLRSSLPVPVRAGDTTRVIVGVRAPDEPGSFRLRVSLVQEGVRWFDAPPLHAFDDLEVEVFASGG